MGRGYMGEILWVDLTRGSIERQPVDDEVYRRFLGGYGLGVKVLWDRMPGGVDPLGPNNVLGFVAGLLTGSGASFSGRWQVVGKSPLTGGWGDANCGGNFAPAIKRCGVDGIFFVGRSAKPVYFHVDGKGNAELVDAADLWGVDALETESLLLERHGKRARVACIGQGGERQSLIAGIVNAKGRVAARSGLGAVMGSKRLKALCLEGKAKVKLADKKRMVALTREFNGRLRQDQAIDKYFLGVIPRTLGFVTRRFTTQMAMAGELFKFTLRKWGTSGLTAMSAENGDSPVKNWAGVGYRDFPINSKSKKISDDAVIAHEHKKYGCHACPVSCGGLCSVKGGKYPIEETHKPEYETLCSFGTMLLNDDLETIFKINDLLNRAGIDTISCGSTVAWAFEAFERGLLTEEDTGGLRLEWGNSEAALAVVEKIIAGEGIGALLKDGVKVAADRLGKGSDEFAMHAGGQELPMHDGRWDAGFALHYEVEPTPARHTIASYQYTDLQALHKRTRRVPPPKPVHGAADRFGVRGKGQVQAVHSNFMDVVNGCGLCLFGVSVGGDMPITEWINAATGWRESFDVYLETGRRIKTLRQAFNLREGIGPEDTKMPPRARGVPPLTDGPIAGLSPDVDALARDYRRAQGWDADTGRPHKHTLVQLGLTEVDDQI